MSENRYKMLKKEQIENLECQGCYAQDWSMVKISEGLELKRLRNVHFIGNVEIGNLSGNIKTADGLEKPVGICNAIIGNCRIGSNCRICNIGIHMANYDIDDNVCIENVGKVDTSPGSTFGNGIEVAVLNEAGGREVILFDYLSAQFAYLMCLHRYRPDMIEKLRQLAKRYVEKIRSDRGRIGQGTNIYSTSEIVNVNIGSNVVINGATSLINGTVLSSAEAPTIIGSNVILKDFIIAEGASVTGGANLEKVFVGQGCLVGRQFSAENSLFFANSEAFHGEACSVFAGPYSVTHHKATLLIACLVSFYNAGSGTNQSNHMYKLGPAHEGKLERGTKTGSFSYMMWPCGVGPFSVILGKHTRTFDTSDFPFSHLDAEPDGRCLMMPGMHLITVGTVRDEAKWRSRDRRKGKKRDIICFDVFSPYTVGKMIKATKILKQLQENTDKSHDEVTIKGAQVKRVLLRTGQKFYRTGIEMYLLGKVLNKCKNSLDGTLNEIRSSFSAEPDAVYSFDWADIGGQLMPRARMLDLTADIEGGKISDIEDFHSRLQHIEKFREKDQWVWVKNACMEVFGIDLKNVTKDQLIEMAETYKKVRTHFLSLVLVDAEKEFNEVSRTGFGCNGDPEDLDEDFHQVRGHYDENKFVKEIKNSIKEVEPWVNMFREKIKALK